MSQFASTWATAAVSDVATFVRGVTYTKSDARDSAGPGLVGVLRANNIANSRFDLTDLVYVPERFVSDAQRLQIGDVVIATSSGSASVVGKAAQVRTPLNHSFGAFCAVLRPFAEVEPGYFGHFFRTQEYRSAASATARGVNINNLKRSHFDAFRIPLPSREEQSRIADMLDVLLPKVDACRERLGRVPAILRKFREAVLEAAVSGRLTEDVSHVGRGSDVPDKLPDDWHLVAFTDLIENIRTGTTAVPKDTPTEYPVLRSSSVRRLVVDLDDKRYVTRQQSSNEDNFLSSGDLLFTRLSGSKEYVGNCALVHSVLPKSIQYPDRLFRAKLKEPQSGRYIELAFSSARVRQQIEAKVKSSAGHQRISTDAIAEAVLPMPPISTQREIVCRVGALFDLANAVEAKYRATVARIERLTPAVLAKAFRGTLVPQDLADEPAK